MSLLLDSNATYWWLIGDPRLSARAQAAIEDPVADIAVTVVTAYELGLKSRQGKLPDFVPNEFEAEVTGAGFAILTLNLAHMRSGAELAWAHRDPWDRLIAAQALTEGLKLVSSDRVFDTLGLERIW